MVTVDSCGAELTVLGAGVVTGTVEVEGTGDSRHGSVGR